MIIKCDIKQIGLLGKKQISDFSSFLENVLMPYNCKTGVVDFV